jgi:tetratricopeptide (TPR) repeat protein
MRLISILLAAALAFSACKKSPPPAPPPTAPQPERVETKAPRLQPPERDPEAARAVLAAREALERRDAATAELALEPLLPPAENDLQVSALLAEIDWLKGAVDEARERAGAVATRLEPHVRTVRDDLASRFVLSRARRVLSDVRGAEVQLRAAIRRGSRDPLAISAWVDLLIQRGTLYEQKPLLDRALEGHPEASKPIVCAARGLALIELDRADESAKLMDKCIEEATEAPGPWRARLEVTRGMADIRRGSLEDAEDHYRLARDLDSRNADARYGLALVAWRLRDKDTAERWLERAIEVRPDPEYAYLLGMVRASSGQLDEAIAVLNLGLERLDMWTRGLDQCWRLPLLLGRVLARQGQYGRAQQVLERALHVDPGPAQRKQILRHLVWVRQQGTSPRAKK